MIHSLTANQASFHAVHFSKGLNLIVAERSEIATLKDTRNGLGKSTLIEIIDFCLGGKADRGKGLIIEPLKEWAFTLEITLAGSHIRATRAISDPGRIFLEGSTAEWPELPEKDGDTGKRFLKADSWKQLLGWALFDIPAAMNTAPYRASYRSLISYFIRRGADAYLEPFRHFRQQKPWDIQLHIAYLLGMGWEYAAQWQKLKDQEEGIRALEKAIKSGALEGALGSVGELETRCIQLEQQAADTRKALESFRVHPQYEAVQREADRLTTEIHTLLNANIADKRRLNRYEEALKEEQPPAELSLERLYEESGLVFSEGVKRSLEEARSFHQNIIHNRRHFLNTELQRIQKSTAGRNLKIRELTEERSRLLHILQTHGALQELNRLQEQHVSLQGTLNQIQTRLKEVRHLNASKREIKASKTDLMQMMEQDHEERKPVWSDAVRLFNEHSQALYRSPGKLVIDLKDKGFSYLVDIEKSGSEGVEKMKIFCFDLTLMQLQQEADRGIDFLIHDTLMFDSVDSRQRALAFERAHGITSSMNAQYICTINSDMIPSADFSDGFDFKNYVRLTLSDATPEDSLLGIRFERPVK